MSIVIIPFSKEQDRFDGSRLIGTIILPPFDFKTMVQHGYHSLTAESIKKFLAEQLAMETSDEISEFEDVDGYWVLDEDIAKKIDDSRSDGESEDDECMRDVINMLKKLYKSFAIDEIIISE